MDNQLVLVLSLKNITSLKEKRDSGNEVFFRLYLTSTSMIKVLFILVSERVLFASYSVQDIEFAAWHHGFHPQAVLQLEELTAGGNAQRLFEVAFGGSEILEPKVL